MKILVVGLDNLGDSIWGTAVFAPIRRAFPDAEISYWVKAYARGLYEDSSSLYRVHSSDPFWDTAPGHEKGDLEDFWSTWKEIRAEKYDAVVLLNTEWRRALAARLAGIPIRVGFRRRKSGFLLTHPVRLLAIGHVVDDNRRLIEGWIGSEIDPALAVPHLEVSVKERDRLRVWLEKKKWLNKTLVVLHPFAGNEIRRWPLAKWKELAEFIVNERSDVRIIWVCGPGEDVLLTEVQASLSEEISEIFCDAPLSEVKAIMSHSHLFIGGDSGPSHMAAALGVPVLSLFGPSDPQRCGPRGTKAVTTLQRLPISDLTTFEVRKAAMALLENIK